MWLFTREQSCQCGLPYQIRQWCSYFQSHPSHKADVPGGSSPAGGFAPPLPGVATIAYIGYRALREITDETLPDDPGRWREWYAAHGARTADRFRRFQEEPKREMR
jgi:hypothetical protein